MFRNINNGIDVVTGSNARVAIDGSFFENIGFVGLFFHGGRGRVTNTSMSVGYMAATTYAGAEVTFQRCEASGLYYGFTAEGGITRVSQSTSTRNEYGLRHFTGTLESFGNNVVRGNANDLVGTITPVALQ